MLYVTTRIKQDAFTASRALSENRGPGGGFFVPMKLPRLDDAVISGLGEKSFSRNVADVINLFFATKLDSWAVEFSIGRYPVKLVNVTGRTVIAETWHNPAWRFTRLVNGVEKAIRQSDQIHLVPSDWLVIAARIAVLFGIFGQLMQNHSVSADRPMDVAVPSGNFSMAAAAWYAREMGLPIANVVVCCNENAGVWNLLSKGELRTDAVAVATDTPDCDYTVPPDLERLVFATLGHEQTQRFCESVRLGRTYYLEPHQTAVLRKGIHAAVVSQRRLRSSVPNLYRTCGYLADPYTALAYSGLMDYRAREGESRPALILSDDSPVFYQDFLSHCMGISNEELQLRLEKR